MNRVFFENGKHADILDEELDLHIKMQKVYNNIYRMRDEYAEKLKKEMENSIIDIHDECIKKYQIFSKKLEPHLDVCLKYQQISLLPDLRVKILKIEKV